MGEFEQAFDQAAWEPNPQDLRKDGTMKGRGWLGVLPIKYPDGKTGVATEFSVGVGLNNKNIDIPTIVPTLAPEELNLMLNDVIPNNKKVPDQILKKAVDHAKQRMKQGLSPYKD